MPSDPNGMDFTDFQLEEIALGRAQEARRRLSSRKNDPDRVRLAEMRKEIEGIQDALAGAGDDPDVDVPSDEMLAEYLDQSITEASRAAVDRALAGSADTRRRLTEMYQDVRAATAGESLPKLNTPEETIVPYSESRSSNEIEAITSNRLFLGGPILSVLFWAGSIFGPPAWQTPAAFAAVSVMSMTMLHRSTQDVLGRMSSMQHRVMQGVLAFVGVGGLALGLFNSGYVATASSIVATVIITLFGTVARSNRGLQGSAIGADEPIESDADIDEESRRHGSGGR